MKHFYGRPQVTVNIATPLQWSMGGILPRWFKV